MIDIMNIIKDYSTFVFVITAVISVILTWYQIKRGKHSIIREYKNFFWRTSLDYYTLISLGVFSLIFSYFGNYYVFTFLLMQNLFLFILIMTFYGNNITDLSTIKRLSLLFIFIFISLFIIFLFGIYFIFVLLYLVSYGLVQNIFPLTLSLFFQTPLVILAIYDVYMDSIKFYPKLDSTIHLSNGEEIRATIIEHSKGMLFVEDFEKNYLIIPEDKILYLEIEEPTKESSEKEEKENDKQEANS